MSDPKRSSSSAKRGQFNLDAFLASSTTSVNAALDRFLPSATTKPATIHKALEYTHMLRYILIIWHIFLQKRD